MLIVMYAVQVTAFSILLPTSTQLGVQRYEFFFHTARTIISSSSLKESPEAFCAVLGTDTKIN